jgi:ATP-grasp domain, R2K clade family 2
MTLGAARELSAAAFIKPPNDKSFAARVYESGADLPKELDDDMTLLVAEPVQWDVEFRCFCLDGRVLAISPYLRSGLLARHSDYHSTLDEPSDAIRFTERVLAATTATTPRAVVVDVGILVGKSWSVVEANSAWGSGIYGCDPDAVLEVIRHASVVV